MKRAARDGRAVFRDGEEMHSALLQENDVEHVMCAILCKLMSVPLKKTTVQRSNSPCFQKLAVFPEASKRLQLSRVAKFGDFTHSCMPFVSLVRTNSMQPLHYLQHSLALYPAFCTTSTG